MTQERFDVVAIGNAIVDVIAHADDGFLEAHGMVKGSMRLIDDATAQRLYEAMGPAVESSGGSAANTAAGIASLGGTVAFIGRVADDVLGQVFTHDIRAAGVSFEPLAPDSDPRGTARCLVLVTPDAQRTLNTYLGVSSAISPRDVDETLVARGRVLYCEGYLWDEPDAKDALLKSMDAARAAGAKVAFTLSDAFCVDRHRAEFLHLAEHRVDILFANEAELLSLYEVRRWEEAAERVAGHCELACLTRSEKGSVVITAAGERVHVDAWSVGKVIDTTGAGDLYAAGFLYGYTHGLDVEASARLGSLAAGEVISHLGARPERSLAALAEDLLRA
ncbi:adenosine kinase [Rhabdothermincola sediminis]|uniref:adenosine kinase n=1 Tax=Rhabdothermincola sediminis TaxID=2751370 RepID=UPI001AA0A065|nr:adenosine kinase [Rhabdothermincola sediminis]